MALMDREAQEEIIFDRLDSLYRVFEMDQRKIEQAKLITAAGSDLQIEVLAAAIASDISFTGVLLEGLTVQRSMNSIAAFAAVYDPLLHEGRSRHVRKVEIEKAMDRYILSDMSIPPRFFDYGTTDFGLWDMFEQDNSRIIRAKRMVAFECAYNAEDAFSSATAYITVKKEMRARALDDSRTDHDATLAFLRNHDGQAITIEQLDLILSGGAPAISEGAL